MKFFKYIFLLTIPLMLTTCGEFSMQEMDRLLLQEMYSRIVEMADSETCDGTEVWGITPIGDKVCGGPMSYMAYNMNINVEEFLELVEDYRKLQESYNHDKGYFVISDCAWEQPPSGVSCDNGTVRLIN